MHGVGFTSTCELRAAAPSKEVDSEGVDVLGHFPRIVENACLFIIVVNVVVCDAGSLGKETRVGIEVKGAWEKATLL